MPRFTDLLSRTRSFALGRWYRQIGTEHIRYTFPATISLLFPRFEVFAFVSHWLAVGIVLRPFIRSPRVSYVTRTRDFNFRSLPVDAET